MKAMDALFYWLQMKTVAEAHPEDEAAQESLLFFAQILSEDHEMVSFDVSSVEANKVHVAYSLNDGTAHTAWFDREAVEQLKLELFEGGSCHSNDSEDEEEAP